MTRLEIKVQFGGRPCCLGGVCGQLLLLQLDRMPQRFEVLVTQGLIDGQPVGGFKDEQGVQKGEGLATRLREEGGKRHFLLGRDRVQEPLGLTALHVGDFLGAGGPDHVKDQGQLVDEIFPREKRLPSQQLGENAADRPHIHCVVVEAVGAQHQLRGPVPACDDVLRHGLLDGIVGVLSFPGGAGTGKAEIRDPKLAGPGDQQVPRFEVPMDDPVVVEKFEAFQDLVHEESKVGIRKSLLGLDDPVQVRVQELHDDVKLVVRVPEGEVLERDDVLMSTQVPHHTNLAQDVFGIDDVRRNGRDTLDGHVFFRFHVQRRTYNAVRAFANWLEVLVGLVDFENRPAHVVRNLPTCRHAAEMALARAVLGTRHAIFVRVTAALLALTFHPAWATTRHHYCPRSFT
jgi:hypothetical protein